MSRISQVGQFEDKAADNVTVHTFHMWFVTLCIIIIIIIITTLF